MQAGGHGGNVGLAVSERFNGVNESQQVTAAQSYPSAALGRHEAAAPPKRSAFPWWAVLGLLVICGIVGVSQHRAMQKLLEDFSSPREALGPSEEEPREREQPSLLPSHSDTQEADQDKPQTPQDRQPSPVTVVEEPPAARPPVAQQKGISTLPRLDDPAEKHSPAVEKGKTLLYFAAESRQYASEVRDSKAPTAEKQQMMEAAANALTAGGSKVLIGTSLVLYRTTDISGSGTSNKAVGPFTIRRVVGYGPHSIYVAAEDLRSKTWTIRIHVFNKKGGKLTFEDFWNYHRLENEMMLRACGDDGVSAAPERRGILVPMLRGEVEGMPLENIYGNYFVVREVTIFKELVGNLEGLEPPIFRQGSNADAAKAYAARRLLLQILYLHKEGVSHNNLGWHSVFVDPSGLAYLGGLESAVRFGEPLPKTAQLNPKFAEPQLLKEFTRFMEGGPPVKANEKSDLWSLGALMFEIFTGRSLQEIVVGGAPFDDIARNVAGMEMNLRKTPSAWRDLVIQLLEPSRKKRISAADIVTKFGSLL